MSLPVDVFVSALVTLLVIVDPPGCAPIFAGLTRNASPAERRAMAIRATLVAAGILLFFAVLGQPFLGALGIGLPAFSIAGGILLFLFATDMIFEKRTQRREARARDLAAREVEDVSVFPMAIPMIAGPGSITTVMLLVARADGLWERAAVHLALAIVLGLTLGALLAARALMNLLGERVEAMITRLLGVLLAALAAQIVVDGLKAAFPLA
ncbi:MAG: MarC family protein [Sphingomonadaceae bacterium]|uniref:MarC family protein n=1 Tax=Thermaurantiacus sp. TaxID=2820283 RepID=UPI00298F12F7|nr:MarC family protein [Thermaurantiacus sp.]MCS6987182.1 MarC family protein [Sphingomonadaceae bacterium]MDW8415784.1 MarC family protein [Thermaurantiacus sp.]